jgi:hypothetical protein
MSYFCNYFVIFATAFSHVEKE